MGAHPQVCTRRDSIALRRALKACAGDRTRAWVRGPGGWGVMSLSSRRALASHGFTWLYVRGDDALGDLYVVVRCFRPYGRQYGWLAACALPWSRVHPLRGSSETSQAGVQSMCLLPQVAFKAAGTQVCPFGGTCNLHTCCGDDGQIFARQSTRSPRDMHEGHAGS